MVLMELEMNGFTVHGRVARGSPQGGVPSPSLWNWMIDSLINKLNHAGLYSLGYADDSQVLSTGW